jgi:hypothetical protein
MWVIEDKIKESLHLDRNKEKSKQGKQTSGIITYYQETKSKNLWCRRSWDANWRNRTPLQ